MEIKLRILAGVILMFISGATLADWHRGKIEMIAVGYDGKTISVGQVGFSRGDCTCYKVWPNRYCLDRSRESFEQEYALLLAAKAKEKSVSINIDEQTCFVRAVYER